MWDVIQYPALGLPLHIISFFGHYGVPVFVFLSGYGLTIKYERTGGELPILQFVKRRYINLVFAMILGYLAYGLVCCVFYGSFTPDILAVLGQLGMFNTLFVPRIPIDPMPFWFFALIMQFYVLWRLLMRSRHWGIVVAMMLACWALQQMCETQISILYWLRCNFVGNMVPFGFGILCARYMSSLKMWQYVVLLLISIPLIVVGSLNYEAWLWVPVAACVFAVALAKILPQVVNKALGWFGGISLAFLAIHPAVRTIFMHYFREEHWQLGIALYFIATVLAAIIINYLSNRIKRLVVK